MEHHNAYLLGVLDARLGRETSLNEHWTCEAGAYYLDGYDFGCRSGQSVVPQLREVVGLFDRPRTESDFADQKIRISEHLRGQLVLVELLTFDVYQQEVCHASR